MLQAHQKQSFLSQVFSRNSAYVLAWILFALALAGPRLADKPRHEKNEIILDVMLVVDLSRSMSATDIKPSRLRRATLEAYDFLSIAKNTRVGITVYSARPHLFVPLTADFKALKFYLQNLDTLQLPTLGSDANAALTFASKELLNASNTKASHKQVMLWLSDGDIEADKITQLEKTLASIASTKIDTYILGLGTPEGGAILLADGSWLESEGQAVMSKTNIPLLQRLAERGNGRFTTVSNDNSDWDSLYQQGILKSLNAPKNNNTQQWKELFPWVLLPAILLLMIALFPVDILRKTPLTNRLLKPNAVTNLVLFASALIIFTLSLPPTFADENKYKSSVKIGIDAYKNTEFAKSKSQFIQSVLSANNNKQRGIALHNLGNALFQTGDFSSAAEVFTDALRYAPDQQATIANQKLAIEIYTLIEKRRNRQMNRGNFAAPQDNAPLFDLPEQIPYILSSKAVMLLKASSPDLPEDELDRLLSKEMQQIQLMQGNKPQNFKEQKQQKEMEQARIHLMGLEEVSSNDLWKRLFEIEEGFPAKLKQPKSIPGVRPW